MEIGGFNNTASSTTQNDEKESGLFNKFVGIVSGIFMPVLGLYVPVVSLKD